MHVLTWLADEKAIVDGGDKKIQIKSWISPYYDEICIIFK